MTENVTIELKDQKFEIDIAKMTAAINDLDKAWNSVASRRMKRGKYEAVLDVLYLCKTGHKINIEDVTPEMRMEIAKELI